MKAIEVLDWIVKYSVNGEFLNVIDVPEEGEEEWKQNEEWWNNQMGACPPYPISAGRYLYFYSSQLAPDVYDSRVAYVAPDMEIECGNDCINLYKVED